MKKNILEIFSGVVLLVLLSKGLGFVRESFIAARYGASFISDVYVFEDSFINTLYTVWAGVISTTYIPMALEFEGSKRNRFTSNYLNIFMMIVIGICVITFLLADQVLHMLVPGFYTVYDMESMEKLVLITRVNVGLLVLVFLENFFIVYLQSKKFYIFSSIQGILLNVSLIFYLAVFYQAGIWGIILTKIIAHGLNVLLLIVFIRKRKLFEYERYINIRESYVVTLVKLACPVFFLNLISQLNYVVDRSMASGLDSGSMALLNYANIIAVLLYSVLGTTISTIAYTEMSIYQKDSTKLSREFFKYFKLLINIITPACIVMIVLRNDLSMVFYGRGKISMEAVNVIAWILLLYIPSNYCLSLRDLMNRLMYIQKRTAVPSIITGISFLINIILNLILVQKIGLYGLALATSISSFLTTAMSYIYIKKKGYLMEKITFNMRDGIACVTSVLACYILRKSIPGGMFFAFVRIGMASISCLLIFNWKLLTRRLRENER